MGEDVFLLPPIPIRRVRVRPCGSSGSFFSGLLANGKGGAGNLLPVATAAGLWLVIWTDGLAALPDELILPRSGSPTRMERTGFSRFVKIETSLRLPLCSQAAMKSAESHSAKGRTGGHQTASIASTAI